MNTDRLPPLDLPFVSRRLPPAPCFDEATALVEQALGELRAAEESLERQLADLRRYLRVSVDPASAPTAVAA
jgi:hypothetical protein